MSHTLPLLELSISRQPHLFYTSVISFTQWASEIHAFTGPYRLHDNKQHSLNITLSCFITMSQSASQYLPFSLPSLLQNGLLYDYHHIFPRS